MIPRIDDIHSKTNSTGGSLNSGDPSGPGGGSAQPALDLAAEIAARYEIAALSGLLAGTRAAAGQDEISVAVLGRFKAGKSSFLNHFMGRNVFPAGWCR